MKPNYFYLAILLVTVTSLTSCEAIEGIFKAGMWVGIVVVVIIVAVVLWLLGKMRK